MRQTRVTSIGVLAGTVLAAASVPAQQPARNRVPPSTVKELLEGRRELTFVPGEVIVRRRVAPGEALRLSAERIAPLGLAPEPRETSGGELVYRLAPDVVTPLSRRAVLDRTLETVERLRAQPDVEYAQPNYVVYIDGTTPNDPDFGRQWHYFENGPGPGRSPGGINLPQTWDTNRGSAAVVVAVIDTGILPDHPDIAGSPNLVPGYDMITNVFRSNDGDGRDPDATDPGDWESAGECSPGSPSRPSSWHGTHVAGTVGVGNTNNSQGVAGINWSVKVQAVRVLGKCGGTTEDVNDGIRWAAGLPVPGLPANPTPARVINMSLGGDGTCGISPSTQRAINDAVGAGTTVVVAAGNAAGDAGNHFPASCDNVITVAASDFRGRLVERYSNYGQAVEILAPGGDVNRDDNDDGDPDGVLSMVEGGYAFYNGTSMAAPHVAGVAALIVASDPAASPAQVLTRIQQTAIPRSSTECPRPCGAGLLNAFTPFVSISLSPQEIKLEEKGRTAALTATLTRGGTPLVGETVTLTSANPAVATIEPASAATDGSGQVKGEVRAQSDGKTTIRAEAGGSTREAPVKVPGLTDAGLVVLAIAMLVLLARARGPQRRPERLRP